MRLNYKLTENIYNIAMIQVTSPELPLERDCSSKDSAEMEEMSDLLANRSGHPRCTSVKQFEKWQASRPWLKCNSNKVFCTTCHKVKKIPGKCE